MKILLKLAVIAAQCLSAGAQTWVTVVPAKQQAPSLSVSLPAGTMYRFLSTNGKSTVPAVATTAPVSDWDDGLSGRPLDPDPGVAKAMQVLELATAFSASVVDSSVKPAKTTTVAIPALPAPAPTPTPVPTPTPTPTPPVVVPISQTPCLCTEFSDNHYECAPTGPKTTVTK